ncbi:T9SS type A sorting domain-containing protein [bacterium]|nr:T9SS type A sorting domain-containing protein [bacterium]
MAMTRNLVLMVVWLAGCSAAAQKKWIWSLDSASVDTGMYAFLEISLGIRAAGPDDEGYLGNFSLAGRALGDILAFDEGQAPALADDTHGLYSMTLTNPPGAGNWQVNGCLSDRMQNGLRVIPSEQPVCRIRFAISDPEGSARMAWTQLQQTFEGDCMTRVSCVFDSPERDFSLKPAAHSMVRKAAVVRDFFLHPGYPNPFNSGVKVVFDLPAGQRVRIAVYNIAGQQVRGLVDENLKAGRHVATWNGTDDSGKAVPSGLFFIRMETGGRSFVRKIVMAR